MFRSDITLDSLNKLNKNSAGEYLGIEFTDLGSDYLVAHMPVDHRTRQPFGILHGGASVLLAETLGSVAAYCCLAEDKRAVGLEINANHVRSVREGYVYGRATPLHIGKSTQIWEIRITNEKEQLVCISRITMSILDKS
ncbi:MAG: hotdog fold thioesterase [Siphonobacter sp.]